MPIVYTNETTSAATFLGAIISSTTVGNIAFTAQISNPVATPSTGFLLFADTSSRLAWKGTNGYLRALDVSANTADRVYTLPDSTGTIALTSSTVNLTGGQTIAGVKTFSSNIAFGSTGTATSTNTPTINAQTGSFTTAVLAAAGGANTTLTVTNSLVTGTSRILASIGGYTGTYGTNGTPSFLAVTAGSGSFTILIRNADATNALSGVVTVNFLVF